MRGTHVHRGIRLLAVTTSLAIAATACGGGSGSEDDGADAAPGTTGDAGAPVDGGTLTYGLEADSDGYDPTKNRWAISGTVIGLAVFDPLVQLDEEDVPRPYLAESIEPNGDYTEWTITLRDGISFHDGTPLTSDAVVTMFEAHLASGLTRPTIAPIESVEAIDDLTATVHMSQPWASFPAVLTAQIGVVPSPAMLEDPDGSRNPVGTGPFEFEGWTNGDRWSGTKNESYWREGLPRLDRVEFRIIPEADTRMQALQSGDVDIMHTSFPELIVRMQDESDAGDYQIQVSAGEGEESFVMLNLEAPPLDDLRVRKALALATDRQAYIDATAEGLPPQATSLFTPESHWFSDTGYPDYDPAAAQELVKEYEAENGPISFDLEAGQSTSNERAIAQLADMWSQVGIEANPSVSEQNAFIVAALGGNYQANLWRQFGAVDPDADAHWWRSDSTLNFARIKDDEVDEALLLGRSSDDVATREEAYATLQQRFTDLLPYIWLHHSIWAIGYQNDVHGVTATFPDGSDHTIPMGGNFTAVHLVTEMWKDS